VQSQVVTEHRNELNVKGTLVRYFPIHKLYKAAKALLIYTFGITWLISKKGKENSDWTGPPTGAFWCIATVLRVLVCWARVLVSKSQSKDFFAIFFKLAWPEIPSQFLVWIVKKQQRRGTFDTVTHTLSTLAFTTLCREFAKDQSATIKLGVHQVMPSLGAVKSTCWLMCYTPLFTEPVFHCALWTELCWGKTQHCTRLLQATQMKAPMLKITPDVQEFCLPNPSFPKYAKLFFFSCSTTPWYDCSSLLAPKFLKISPSHCNLLIKALERSTCLRVHQGPPHPAALV